MAPPVAFSPGSEGPALRLAAAAAAALGEQRTQDRMMMSSCCPWKESTVATGICDQPASASCHVHRCCCGGLPMERAAATATFMPVHGGQPKSVHAIMLTRMLRCEAFESFPLTGS